MTQQPQNIFENQMPPKLAFSIAEVAEISGLGRTLIFSEIKMGHLVARKCGRRTLVLVGDLQQWLKALPSNREKPQTNKSKQPAGAL